MNQQDPALRLTILIGDSDHWHHSPLSVEIVHRAHRQGLAGASVFHGVEGFGASSVSSWTRSPSSRMRHVAEHGFWQLHDA